MKKTYTLIILLLLFSIFRPHVGRSTITSIVLTPANPTVLSNTLGYYLAGKTYNFQVQVIDPDARNWADISNVILQIPNAGGANDIQITTTFDALGSPTAVVDTGGVTVAVAGGGAAAYNNFTITLTITFLWNMPQSIWGAARIITATANSNWPVANSLFTTQTVSYGINASMAVLSFSMTGEASDGRVNRWHSAFTAVTPAGGEIVYNVPGAGAADAVRIVAGAAEITNSYLYINGILAFTLAGNPVPPLTYNVAAAFFNANGIADSGTARTVQLRASTTTAGGPVLIGNTLPLICDQVAVSAITFTGGGGVNNPPTDYYRATNVPGTQIQVTANMLAGGGTMEGNTDIVIRDSDNNDVTVTIPNGNNTGTANITIPAVVLNHLTQKSYFVYNVTSGAYASAAGFGQNANLRGRINQPGSGPLPAVPPDRSIWWNNQLRPSRTGGPTDYTASNPFTTWFQLWTSTAQTFTIYWNALPAGNPNGDFSSYKIYYKKTSDAIWTAVDKNTIGFAALGLIGTSSTSIQSLAPLTKYDYQISAYDLFGNEVAYGDRPLNNLPGTCPNCPPDLYCAATTTSSSITVSVTDGITTYDNNSFAGYPNPVTSHPLRKSAIKITATVITGGNIPESVNLVFANNNTDVEYSDPTLACLPGINQYNPGAGGCPGGQGTNDDITFLGVGSKYSLPFTKYSGNVWFVYIPSDHPIMNLNTTIRFIIETVYQGIPTRVDHTNPQPLPGNWWSDEWRIHIATQPTFTPWPVRILNNVMDANNPLCYPSYYLTDDAFVTITAYDIKGRQVATLIDNQLRKGGQNIKEGGWDGTNKSNRKLGVGLYYIRFYATRASDGKVILNEFHKVVMAR